nr:SGNH/GDSL hydrolase family protein [uncultured Clostridium sp.]
MIRTEEISNQEVTVSWDRLEGAEVYRVYWSDRDTELENYRFMEEMSADDTLRFTLYKSTHIPHYIRICAVKSDSTIYEEVYVTSVHYIKREQLETLNRGLTAVRTKNGVFLSWRLFLTEVTGYKNGGLTGVYFHLYRNGTEIAKVIDSTNYLDPEGDAQSEYGVAPAINGIEYDACPPVKVWDKEYLDIPLKKPEPGVTPSGEAFTYSANDMSVADVDGDGEYEYIVKWDPSNSHDVSIKGYTGRCYIDCYKLDGTLLWRLDMGPNIRAGAHYTQFMCFDFNGDGKAEMAVKTAPGTRMTVYGPDGKPAEEFFITMPEEDLEQGYSHEDSYVCSFKSYRKHLTEVFRSWKDHPEVKAGHWPESLEQCFGIPGKYSYPLSQEDSECLTDYFLDIYAPSRSPENNLREFEGFIFEGPEYLTMFGGDGKELQTIPFPFERVDDGLLWGDYAMNRIEPCNRVDRFLSAVAYLDGKRPYLVVCRGYYTRAAIAAYDFFDNCFHETWSVDSGFVPMKNPFCDNPHDLCGTDPVYGELAGQGNHSVSTADVDGDGCMEILYGAACIDHDGSLLYSSRDKLPDGRTAKLGHGDAMHVADIDPDRPGYEIFNVFEGADHAPYGYALRDAHSGKVLFGEYANKDLGRCMIGDVVPGVRGLQCWVNGVGTYDCHGKLLKKETLGSNMSIRWAGDLTTQITDGADYLSQKPTGVINDFTHGIMLRPENTLTNNGTKGNPCLTADIFGDFREEILLRTEDSSAIRIYTNTELTDHKLFTLMHDVQYRCGVAWQNNCYNQPCYPEFYYASDMEFNRVLPYMNRKPVIYLAGDSITQTGGEEDRPGYGLGEMLLKHLDEGNCYETYHREDCPFKQEMRYESRHLIVDNCAMSGRSTRTFLEEGRLEDIRSHIREGDYLFIQFGHNDASATRAERYVPVSDFPMNLKHFTDAARKGGAVPVLISPVSLCPCKENQEGEKGEIARLLPGYSRQMEDFAKKEGILYIDMNRLTKQHCETAGETDSRRLYIPDLVHLSRAGADCYARLLANEGKTLIIDKK